MEKVIEDRADRIGVCASALCLAHCLVVPFAIPLAPTFAHEVEESIHVLFALIVLSAAVPAFIAGYRRHHNWMTTLLGVSGLSLVLCAVFISHQHVAQTNITWQGVVTSIGGLMLITAHLKNLSLCNHAHHRLQFGASPDVKNL